MKALRISMAILLIPFINLGQTNQEQVIRTTEKTAQSAEMQAAKALTGSLIISEGFKEPDNASTNLGEIEVGYSIYPNPASDILYIDFTSEKQTKVVVEVFDVQGKQMEGLYRIVDIFGTTKEKLNISPLSDGNYFIRFKDKENRMLETVKFQKVE